MAPPRRGDRAPAPSLGSSTLASETARPLCTGPVFRIIPPNCSETGPRRDARFPTLLLDRQRLAGRLAARGAQGYRTDPKKIFSNHTGLRLLHDYDPD